MSLFPLDLGRYKRWTIEQLYYLLYPYIMRDFMGRDDCRNVHLPANMSVATSDGPKPVVHILQGGTDLAAQIKGAAYRLRAEGGNLTISAAKETGEFTG